MRIFQKVIEEKKFPGNFFEEMVLKKDGYNGKDALVVHKIAREKGTFYYVLDPSNRTVLNKPGYEATTYRPYVVRNEMTINHEDLKFLQAEENAYKADDGEKRFKRLVGDLSNRVGELYFNTLDEIASSLLNTGKISDKGEKMINYQIPSEQVVTLSGNTKWDNAASKKVNNLLDWKNAFSKRSGYAPDMMLMGEKVLGYLINDDKVKSFLDNRNITGNQLAVSEQNDKVTAIGRLGIIGCDVYTHASIEEDTIVLLSKRKTLGLAYGSLLRGDASRYERVFTKFVRNEKEGTGSLVIDSSLFLYFLNSARYFRAKVA